MTKLVVINSFGPMGSTLLSGLCEKLGFTNIPLRKLGLHQYLMGEKKLDSGYMQSHLAKALQEHSKPALRGGVSVVDRDNQAPKALLDCKKVEGQVEKIVAKNVQDLYFQCRNIYTNAVIYKTVESRPDWQIELTTDIHRYDHKALYKAYQDHFDDVKMIHLHRPFDGWINSLASQAFVHPEIVNRIKFFPHMRYADYRLYEEAVAAMPGMNIHFDDMFNKTVETLYAEIAAFTGVDTPAPDLRNTLYDLYGKLTPYDVAFKKFDDNMTFLTSATKGYLGTLAENGKIARTPHNIVAWLRYLNDMMRYRMQHKARAA